ncbi:hypothetical protein [Nannocystis pusilla]|uniref:hypothetical protein n=1 Tax=Nannocystis pusilla TaxID=889268 RepID=UPI003B82629B
MMLRRQGGAWFKAVSSEGINGVDAPDGVTFSSDAMAVLFMPTPDGWSATTAISDLVPTALPGPIGILPLEAGDHIYEVQPNLGVARLPETEAVAPGQVYWVSARDNDGVTIQLGDPVNENIDGIVGASVRLTNRGDQAMFKRDGATGWRMVWNLYGRFVPLYDQTDASENLATSYPDGWPGTLSRVYSNVADNVDVTLPCRNLQGRHAPPCISHAGKHDHLRRRRRQLHRGKRDRGGVPRSGWWPQRVPRPRVRGPRRLVLRQVGDHARASQSRSHDGQFPLSATALTSDVTVILASSDNDANILILPAFTNTQKMVQAVNTGGEDLIVRIAGGTMNGSAIAQTTLAPSQSVEFRYHSASVYCAVKSVQL